MNLNQTTISIRPRNPYEAMDLGATMVRAWWKDLWLLWFAVSLPFALGIWFAMVQFQEWALLLLWWCKPLWETVILHFIAEKVFNADTTFRDILPKALRLMLHDLPLKLTLRRLSITRSFDMPVGELERLHGAARNRRLNILHRTSSSAAIWLTVIGAHLESMMGLAILLLIWMFIPEYIAMEMDLWDFLLSDDYSLLGFLMGYGVISAVGPFYVTCGFSLYINRRTLLEGWDIELRFKQLANRLSDTANSHSKRTAAALMLLVSLTGLTMGYTPSAQANYMATTPDQLRSYSAKQSRQDIIEVMESDAFNRIKEDEVLLPKNRELETIEDDAEIPAFIKALLRFFQFIAQSIEVILWGIAIALVIFLLIKLNEYRLTKGKGPRSRTIERAPDTLFGLDIRRDSLPNDILGSARQLWKEQRYRDAYSLLYRGSLVFIAHEKNVRLHESFTEEECVQRFQASDDSLQPLFFAQLTQQWQMVAYGHQIPASTLFETTCDGWQFHFGGSFSGGPAAHDKASSLGGDHDQ